MSETTQSKLRFAIDWMKADSGKGTKSRKQERFRSIYQPEVAHIVAGERYDDSGVGPMTAQSAVENVYPNLDIDAHDTITEALATVESRGDEQSLTELVIDLDMISLESGNDQQVKLEGVLEFHAEPSLVTLALLDDENIGLGVSQMKDAFFDGTRDERKHAEAFCSSTEEFIRLAQENELPDGPTVGEPFGVMLAKSESHAPEFEEESEAKWKCQVKIDGYRALLQAEWTGDGHDITIFSRAKNDITDSLPELEKLDLPEGSYIIDGEITNKNRSYSEVSKRIGRKRSNIDNGVEMQYAVFDLIVYDGEDISQRSFDERNMLLSKLVTQIDDDRVWLPELKSDYGEAKRSVIESDQEGLILKQMDAKYEFGKRSSNWCKKKMDAETVDVVITGFEEGTGEASGTLGAVSIESADGVSLGRSGSGFSDSERASIWNNQDEWLGEVIEVEARGLNENLRMPIFLHHRDEGAADPMDRIEELMKDV